MKTVTSALSILLIFSVAVAALNVQAESSSIALSGKQFKIKEGDFSSSTATFSFNYSTVVWKQCNYYRCSFKQIGDNIQI